MKTIVFAGGSSLLAQSWIREEQVEYNFILGIHNTVPNHNKWRHVFLTYEDPKELAKQFQQLKADVVVNCIGLTNVEACENDQKLAEFTNVEIANTIAKACKDSNIKLVHISTDHLFDGDLAFACEHEKKVPLNVYGITKSKGEDIVLDTNPSALIIRTNFFGWGPKYKPSFSDKILESLKKNKPIQLFNDVYYTPVSVANLRENILDLLEKNASGVYNVASNERITKYEFGCRLAEIFGFAKTLIEPVSLSSINGLTQRPKDMSLSNHKLSVFLSKAFPSLKEQIITLKEEEKQNEERFFIPYGRQEISDKDIDAVVEVLRSDFITQGPVVRAFERRVANYCGVKYGYACNSATSALHIACLALGVGEGDIVWTSPISFVASSNCALYCNAQVDFVDIDRYTYNMSPIVLEKKLEQAKKEGRLPKVVIPVHLAGQSCDMEHIHELSKIYGFKIIEDASHGIGAQYKQQPVGSCVYSDITVFSFHPVKIITTGEGGMCLTNDPELSLLLERYRSHGITRQASEMSKVPDGPWYYEQLNLGLNYRMNDIQAALGLSQMDRLDEFVNKRRAIARRYDQLLNDSIVQIPQQNPDTNSSWHLYIIRLKKNTKITQKQLFEKFRAAGILVNIHYIPIYRQPYYKDLGFSSNGFEEAEKYYEEAISIPIFPSLSNKEQQKVVSLIEQKPVGFQNLF